MLADASVVCGGDLVVSCRRWISVDGGAMEDSWPRGLHQWRWLTISASSMLGDFLALVPPRSLTMTGSYRSTFRFTQVVCSALLPCQHSGQSLQVGWPLDPVGSTVRTTFSSPHHHQTQPYSHRTCTRRERPSSRRPLQCRTSDTWPFPPNLRTCSSRMEEGQ